MSYIPSRRIPLPRKSQDEDYEEDDDKPASGRGSDDDDDVDDDDEDTIDLDTAEDEEEDEDDDDEDDEDDDDDAESVDQIERRRLFQAEAEEILEHLTLDDVKEVLVENDLDGGLAAKLKRFLTEVIREGEVDNMDDAWEEAMDRLEEEV